MSAQKLADRLPFAGLVDDGILITKEGSLLRTFYVDSQDFAFQEDQFIFSCLKGLANTLRLICDATWAIDIDVHRVLTANPFTYFDPAAPTITKYFEDSRKDIGPIYSTRFFLTITKEASPDKNSITKYLFKKNTDDKAEDANLRLTFKQNLYEFKTITTDFYNGLGNTFRSATPLDNDNLLTYLHSTFSHPQKLVRTPELPFYLDMYLADGIFTPDVISKYNDEYICTASIHDFPLNTTAGMISKILTLPMEFRLSTRFVFVNKEDAKKTIKEMRKAHFQKRKGLGSMFQEAVVKEETQLQDTEALALTTDSSLALSELADGQIAYGYLTTVAVVRDKNLALAQKKIEIIKSAMLDEGLICKAETINNPSAFLGSIPGNLYSNPRKALISTRALMHFFPLSASWTGIFTNVHMQSEYVKRYNLNIVAPHVVCRTSQTKSIFYLNLNYNDIGHTLIVGPTGSGKSILLNTLCIFFLKYPETEIIFFDVDKSSQHPCNNANGLFIEISDDTDSLKFNPFAAIDDKQEQTFVTQLIVDFLISKDMPIGVGIQQDIYTAISEMAKDPIETRSFSSFQAHIQDSEIRKAIEVFISGDYSGLFKSGLDTIQPSRWTTFEMRKLMAKGPIIVEFILSYIFHVIERRFDGSKFSLLALDESWLFIANPRFAKRIEDWLRTMRKKNVYVLLATQNISDAFNSAIFATILNACFTKILLPNPRATQPDNLPLYKSMGLIEADIGALQDATPKRDYLYVSPNGKQLFELCLTKRELDLLKAPMEGKGL